ncbi:MAG: 50S ribosomal protein L13 [Candidatus Spechtbacteria bacterium RIFCSPLOWO2_12_FULL_38_22]|uniref:Large ribosomal subunit protein uL13 n=1 Tax=Candidatus Spechtbacteria bacterium RIFCSPLOWO2_12_FULL_38_22 TaxID=1802165 RepID=A0A1G2HKC4_9BACT|nr:MAG: 50S ribosomal protein L13 [Candidatus Spechtbacteria bacterium RIFCSPHIGHO2_01_FULL_38_11]OGZ62358.1 MAG: 50S ribosomal protein L13 [Candidatus Spechtbacteria bacterium RIFCSPLOWO2_12_FULL_38_22]
MSSKTKTELEIIELDAEGQVLGRLASDIAHYLQGKHKADYQPNKESNTTVKVKNAGKISITGKKAKNKVYRSHSGYPGGLYGKTYADTFKKDPSSVIKYAVRGMLPKNRLRKLRMERLVIEG